MDFRIAPNITRVFKCCLLDGAHSDQTWFFKLMDHESWWWCWWHFWNIGALHSCGILKYMTYSVTNMQMSHKLLLPIYIYIYCWQQPSKILTTPRTCHQHIPSQHPSPTSFQYQIKIRNIDRVKNDFWRISKAIFNS